MPEPGVREREALAAEVQSLTARLEACESALTTAHENWAADRDTLARVAALAEEAAEKGAAYAGVPELRLVSNAYTGMADRIRRALGGAS